MSGKNIKMSGKNQSSIDIIIRRGKRGGGRGGSGFRDAGFRVESLGFRGEGLGGLQVKEPFRVGSSLSV